MGSANGEGETANVEGKAGESSDKGIFVKCFWAILT